MIQLKIRGFDKLVRRMEAATADRVIAGALTKGAYYMQAWIQRKRLTGPRPEFLGVISGRLRSSIAVAQAQKSGDNYIARIGTNVVYGAIHEFGMPGRMPARPFMRPALEDAKNKEFVLNLLINNIKRATEKP